MAKRTFPKAYQNLIDSILYTRRRLKDKHFKQSRKHAVRPRHRSTKRCTRRK